MSNAKQVILDHVRNHPGIRSDELYVAIGVGISRRAFTEALVALREGNSIENRGGGMVGHKWFLPEHPAENRAAFELVFVDIATDKVVYAIADVAVIRHITPSEVGFTDTDGHIRSASFPRSEKLVVDRRSTDDRRAQVSHRAHGTSA